MTDPKETVLEVMAAAVKAECDNFSAPVSLYVEGEAARRWERDNPGLDAVIDDGPTEPESWRIIVRAALAALEAAGFAVVPVQPTEEMIDVGATEVRRHNCWTRFGDTTRRTYDAMLSASKPSPSPKD